MSDDRELSTLYQSSDKPQPPAALDKTIRAAAHKAVEPKRSHAPQWLGGIAASIVTALLITQMMPTVEQEAEVSVEHYNMRQPASDALAPGLELHEEAIPQDAKPERAKTDKQTMQEKAELKRSPVRNKAAAQDEADSISSSEPVEKPTSRTLLTPSVTSSSPENELQAIIDLLDADRIIEAKQKLDNFRNSYPEADIPETITRRLEASDPG